MYKQIAILSVLICFLAASALAAQMSVEPVYQEAFQGDDITVNITVDPEGSEVYGASYILYFNNTVLNAKSLVKGPFLTQDGNSSNIQYPPTEINNTAGEIEYVEYKMGAVPGVTGCGVLTTITFQVIGEEGTSQLNLGDSDGLLLCTGPPIVEPIPTTVNNGSAEVRKGVCGDVDGFEGVTTNDGWLVFMNASKPQGDPRYQLADPWAADCDGFSGITTNDGWLIFMNASKPQGDPRYMLTCC